VYAYFVCCLVVYIHIGLHTTKTRQITWQKCFFLHQTSSALSPSSNSVIRLQTLHADSSHAVAFRQLQRYSRWLKWVDGICGSGQIGTVKTVWVENAGVDISARCGKGGQCRSGLISTVWQGWTMREVRRLSSCLNCLSTFHTHC